MIRWTFGTTVSSLSLVRGIVRGPLRTHIFVDKYVIPLAQRVSDCGVLGAAGESGLVWAIANRDEWKAKGERIVEEMLERVDEPEDLDDMSLTSFYV